MQYIFCDNCGRIIEDKNFYIKDNKNICNDCILGIDNFDIIDTSINSNFLIIWFDLFDIMGKKYFNDINIFNNFLSALINNKKIKKIKIIKLN